MQFTEKFKSVPDAGDAIEYIAGSLVIRAEIRYDSDMRVGDDEFWQDGEDDSAELRAAKIKRRKDYDRGFWTYGGLVLSAYLENQKKRMLLDEYAASVWGLEIGNDGCAGTDLDEIANQLLAETCASAMRIISHMREAIQRIALPDEFFEN